MQAKEWVVKFTSLLSDDGCRGLCNPYKPCYHNLYTGIIIFPHIDNTQSKGHNLTKLNLRKIDWKKYSDTKDYKESNLEEQNLQEQVIPVAWCHLCPLLLTWFNFNPSMDK